MIRLARDCATVANDLLDSSCDAFLAPALSLYREAIFALLGNDMAGKKALAVAFETDPDSIWRRQFNATPASGGSAICWQCTHPSVLAARSRRTSGTWDN